MHSARRVVEDAATDRPEGRAQRGGANTVASRVDGLDYRELDERPFDKIASVGMYEHVGREQLDTYVDMVHRLLRPGGLFLNHGITRIHTQPPRGPTFIGRYVFPDGELHPVTDIIGALEAGGFEIRDVESLREHYALTLRRWVANLAARREAAVAEIGEERERVWRLYTLGSAQGFEDREIGIYQTLAVRAGAAHALPFDRSHLLL